MKIKFYSKSYFSILPRWMKIQLPPGDFFIFLFFDHRIVLRSSARPRAIKPAKYDHNIQLSRIFRRKKCFAHFRSRSGRKSWGGSLFAKNHSFFIRARIARGKRCPTRPTGPETRSPRTLDDPRYPVFFITPLGRKVTVQNVPRTTLKRGEGTFPSAFI